MPVSNSQFQNLIVIILSSIQTMYNQPAYTLWFYPLNLSHNVNVFSQDFPIQNLSYSACHPLQLKLIKICICYSFSTFISYRCTLVPNHTLPPTACSSSSFRAPVTFLIPSFHCLLFSFEHVSNGQHLLPFQYAVSYTHLDVYKRQRQHCANTAV